MNLHIFAIGGHGSHSCGDHSCSCHSCGGQSCSGRLRNEFIRSSHLWLRTLCLALGLAGFGVMPMALAQSTAAELQREYFIRQGADESLLIRISANGADIDSNVYASEKRLLMSSSTNGNRITPLFQFIDGVGADRQLDIAVTAAQFTDSTQFEIGITRLKIWDNRSKSLARAYSLLSFGMQNTGTESAASWSVKVNSLMGAAETFGQFGMTELKLWSTWLATNLIQSRLNDNNMALGLLKEVQSATRASQWLDIDLASQQTKSMILVGLLEQGGATNLADVQNQLLKTAEQAERMGYRVTQSEMLYQSGLQYIAQSDETSGLPMFQKALGIAEDVNDVGLIKSIRESIADLHAEQGDDQATAAVLRQLESQLAQEGSDRDELALNLLQQGRIFMRIWEFPQAIDVLQQALGFENDSSIASQINQELAVAHFEIGQADEAQRYLEAAGIKSRDAASFFNSNTGDAKADASGLRAQAESRYQKARALAQSGNRKAAIQELDLLLDQVLFLRQTMPGVLGSWYWRRQQAILDDYLALGVADDAETLLALSKSRIASKVPIRPVETHDLRNVLAQSGANDSVARSDLARLRSQFEANMAALSISGMQAYFAQLSADEVVITYHLSAAGAFVWVADSKTIKSQRLGNHQDIINRLETTVRQISLANSVQFETLMTGLGDVLLKPVKQDLKGTVYLLTSGLMMSLPFDSLRLDQRYLAEQHSVVNVLTFPLGNPASRFQKPTLESVFLAGDPQDFQAEYANTWQPSEAIKAVKDIFVGPGLNIIQGAALLPDEFQSEAYRQSNLVHLSMPGAIDLGHPDQSWLQLSEPLRDMQRMLLRPDALRGDSMQAGLVYLAATHTNGMSASPLNQQLGLVSDLLQSGAKAVIAQLWSTSDESANNFLKDYYAELKDVGNVATALANSKQTAIRNPGHVGVKMWSSMQIYVE